jgi:hypothetical protein
VRLERPSDPTVTETHVATTDHDRNHLYNTLRETIGDHDAATMMELLPPVGWADVARRSDVDALRAHVDIHFETVDRRFVDIDRRFGDIDRRFGDIDRRFGDIDRRFDELPSIFATKDDLRAQTERFIGWMLASQVSFFTIMSVLIVFTR